MSNYTPITNFLSKDALSSGNPAKAVKGADLTTEFNAVSVAVNSKLDGTASFFPDGTASQPSVGFTNLSGAGMYNAAGVLGFAFGGVLRATLDTNGLWNVYNGTGTNFSPVYAGIPVNAQASNYTAILSDANKGLVKQGTGGSTSTFTIPSNASVAFPIGTAITIHNAVNMGVLTVTLTTDTLVWAQNGNLASTRFLASAAMVTIYKINATTWVISGVGIS